MATALKKLPMTQRVLAVLEESSLPISTPDLIAIVATGMSHPRGRVWAALSYLRSRGLIVSERGRTYVDSPGCDGPLVTLWRLAPTPEGT